MPWVTCLLLAQRDDLIHKTEKQRGQTERMVKVVNKYKCWESVVRSNTTEVGFTGPKLWILKGTCLVLLQILKALTNGETAPRFDRAML